MFELYRDFRFTEIWIIKSELYKKNDSDLEFLEFVFVQIVERFEWQRFEPGKSPCFLSPHAGQKIHCAGVLKVAKCVEEFYISKKTLSEKTNYSK